MLRAFVAAILVSAFGFVNGCLPYMYNEREPALVKGVDVDQTLKVARDELRGDSGLSVLTLWALRDQPINDAQAKEVSRLYFEHIERINHEDTKMSGFQVWHLTWGISNMYRYGDLEVKTALLAAYSDTLVRVKNLDRSIVTEHATGDKMYAGFAHAGGRAYARSHLVVPGNEEYLQSYCEYLKEQSE